MPKKAAAAKKVARTRSTMSDEHKAALAEGRDQGRAVRRYLEALETSRPSGAASARGKRSSVGSKASTRSSRRQILSPGSTYSRSAKTSRRSSSP